MLSCVAPGVDFDRSRPEAFFVRASHGRKLLRRSEIRVGRWIAFIRRLTQPREVYRYI